MMLARSTYGLRRFFMKEDVLGPESNYIQVMQKNRPELFHDIRVAAKISSHISFKTNQVYFKDILNHKNFNQYVAYLT